MMAKMKGCVCFILFLSFFIAHASDIDRPEYPSAYGMCYGALLGQMKLTGGKLSGQKAVDFYNKWTPYYKQLTEQVKKQAVVMPTYLMATYRFVMENYSAISAIQVFNIKQTLDLRR